MRSRDRVPSFDVTCEWDGAARPVANLSLGGFFVSSDHPLPVGQVVALRLLLPDRSLAVEGKVAWINESGSPKNPALPSGFGVAIRKIDIADKLALVEFLRTRRDAGGVTPRRRAARPGS